MTPYPGFGVVLQRVLEHRGADAAWLAEGSGLALPELRAVLDGTVPTAEQLHALASALGYRVQDLFVLADVPVPLELTPLDPKAGGAVHYLLDLVDRLPPDRRREINEMVAGLPQEPRPALEGQVRGIYSPAEGGFGAVLMTMLCHTRNLYSDVAYTMAVLSRGQMYLSRSTYRAMVTRRTPLRPEWISSIALVLGIPAGDLSAMTGVALPAEPPRTPRRTAELLDLLWNCRRLTAAQAREVQATAEAMFVPIPENAPEDEWNRLYRTGDGVWWGAPRVPEE